MRTVFAFGLLSYLLLSPTIGNADGIPMEGIVVDQKSQPIGGATVFISTAAPRVGIGVL